MYSIFFWCWSQIWLLDHFVQNGAISTLQCSIPQRFPHFINLSFSLETLLFLHSNMLFPLPKKKFKKHFLNIPLYSSFIFPSHIGQASGRAAYVLFPLFSFTAQPTACRHTPSTKLWKSTKSPFSLSPTLWQIQMRLFTLYFNGSLGCRWWHCWLALLVYFMTSSYSSPHPFKKFSALSRYNWQIKLKVIWLWKYSPKLPALFY